MIYLRIRAPGRIRTGIKLRAREYLTIRVTGARKGEGNGYPFPSVFLTKLAVVRECCSG